MCNSPVLNQPTLKELDDYLAKESAQIDSQLKALFLREAEHFERQLVSRNMQLNSRALAQLELNLREFLNKAIADIERDLDDAS